MMNTQKRDLVIVRAGQNSLHNSWLDVPYAERSYDVIVSYFDQTAFESHEPEIGVSPFLYKGGKWDGLYYTINAQSQCLDRYDFIWLPDDDIHCSSKEVNAVFAAMRQNNIKVGQPSLSADSYFTHFLMIQCPSFQLRYSNFIEVMVPCLHKDILKAMLPHFQHSMSGFGFDYIWCRLAGTGQFACAIFDEIQVHHTRPVGKVLLSAMERGGINPKDEERALCELYGVEMNTTPIAYAGITANGLFVKGKTAMAWHMMLGYSSLISGKKREERQFGRSKITQMIRRQITRPCDITTRQCMTQANFSRNQASLG